MDWGSLWLAIQQEEAIQSSHLTHRISRTLSYSLMTPILASYLSEPDTTIGLTAQMGGSFHVRSGLRMTREGVSPHWHQLDSQLTDNNQPIDTLNLD